MKFKTTNAKLRILQIIRIRTIRANFTVCTGIAPIICCVYGVLLLESEETEILHMVTVLHAFETNPQVKGISLVEGVLGMLYELLGNISPMPNDK